VQQDFVTGFQAVTDKAGRLTLIPVVTPVQTGLTVSALPVISGDGRLVSVQLDVADTVIDQPVETIAILTPLGTRFIQEPAVHNLEVHTTVVVPDGGTVLLARDGSVVDPSLESIPGPGAFISVTARVIITESGLDEVAVDLTLIEVREKPRPLRRP
jgi:hypothetical protein